MKPTMLIKTKGVAGTEINAVLKCVGPIKLMGPMMILRQGVLVMLRSTARDTHKHTHTSTHTQTHAHTHTHTHTRTHTQRDQ